MREHLGEVVLCDIRWYLDGRSGREAWRAGHLPGAVWIDLDRILAAAPSPKAGRHPLPAPEVFAAGLAEAGISDTDTVVAYDDSGGMAAGRLVWLLRITDHRAALLDGGIAAWPDPLSTAEPKPPRPPGRFTARPWPPERLASIEEVVALTAGTPRQQAGAAPGAGIVIDARAPARFRGETEPVDPRAGHIPGAVNIPYPTTVDPGTGRFLGPDRLRARFESAGVRKEIDVVVYCGSGVSACVDLLALEAAGFGAARLYPGSWSQWSANPDLPAATGE